MTKRVNCKGQTKEPNNHSFSTGLSAHACLVSSCEFLLPPPPIMRSTYDLLRALASARKIFKHVWNLASSCDHGLRATTSCKLLQANPLTLSDQQALARTRKPLVAKWEAGFIQSTVVATYKGFWDPILTFHTLEIWRFPLSFIKYLTTWTVCISFLCSILQLLSSFQITSFKEMQKYVSFVLDACRGHFCRLYG